MNDSGDWFFELIHHLSMPGATAALLLRQRFARFSVPYESAAMPTMGSGMLIAVAYPYSSQ